MNEKSTATTMKEIGSLRQTTQTDHRLIWLAVNSKSQISIKKDINMYINMGLNLREFKKNYFKFKYIIWCQWIWKLVTF